MTYTWEEVLFSIDTKQEALNKQAQQEDIQEKQLKEADAASAWSLGLSILGFMVAGPSGYAAGKILGRQGADLYYDWEGMTIDEGKFNVEEARKFNKSITKAAEDQTKGQMVNTLIDLGTMYVQAGGFKEGFDPTIGGGDWTTFGTGDDAWTVFGEGTWADKIPGAGTLPGEQSIFAGGGTPIWQKGGLKQLLGNIKKGDIKGAYATDLGINTVSDLARMWSSSKEIEEEKPKDGTIDSNWGRG